VQVGGRRRRSGSALAAAGGLGFEGGSRWSTVWGREDMQRRSHPNELRPWI
jgi:hypothetical protein